MSFNQLMTTMYINSPMIAALKADELRASTMYYELVSATAQANGRSVGEFISLDRYLDRSRQGLLVPSDIVATEDEATAAREQAAQQQMMAVAGSMAERAAPQLAQAAMQPEPA